MEYLKLNDPVPVGFHLVEFGGKSEFPTFDMAGLPTGWLFSFYAKGGNTDGVTWYKRYVRRMTSEELDAVELRFSDGTTRPITYGQYCSEQPADNIVAPSANQDASG